jgi:hypothetical protein
LILETTPPSNNRFELLTFKKYFTQIASQFFRWINLDKMAEAMVEEANKEEHRGVRKLEPDLPLGVRGQNTEHF